MTAATSWRWCAVAGVVAFLCSWGFGQIPGLVACGHSGGLGPIIAFEFVRSPADVAALFGSEPCQSTLVAAQRTGLLLDGLGFTPAYVAFLSFAARAVGGPHPLAKAVVIVIIVAGLADEIEGILLYRILGDIPGTQALIDALWWPVHVKFALLAVGGFGIAILLLAHRYISGIVAALAITIGSCTAIAGLMNGPSPVMMIGFTMSWVTILLCAFLGSWRASLFSVRGDLPPGPGSPSA